MNDLAIIIGCSVWTRYLPFNSSMAKHSVIYFDWNSVKDIYYAQLLITRAFCLTPRPNIDIHYKETDCNAILVTFYTNYSFWHFYYRYQRPRIYGWFLWCHFRQCMQFNYYRSFNNHYEWNIFLPILWVITKTFPFLYSWF